MENQITLSQPLIEQITGLIESSEAVSKSYGGEVKAEIIQALQPDFLLTKSILLFVRLKTEEKVFTDTLLCTEKPRLDEDESGPCSDYHISVFDQRSYTAFSAAEREFETPFLPMKEFQTPLLKIDNETVIEYFRYFLPALISPALLVESISDISTYSPKENFEQKEGFEKKINFYTPLLEEEIEKIEKALEQNILRIVEETPDSFIIESCILEHNSLDVIRYQVFKENQAASLGAENPKIKGQIEYVETVKTPVRGIPDNYIVSRHPAPGLYWTDEAVDNIDGDRGFESVRIFEQTCILDDVGRNLRPLISKAARFQRRYLSIYEMDLLEISAQVDCREAVICLLWKPGIAICLDGSSAPIHELNESIFPMLDRERLFGTFEEVAEYCRFFCEYVWGEEGPFHIVESSEDPFFQDGLDEWHEEKFTSAEDVLNAVAPLKDEGEPEENTRELSAIIAYGNALFSVKFAVTGNGMVEMTDDAPLAIRKGWSMPERPEQFQLLLRNTDLGICEADSMESSALENKIILGNLKPETLTLKTIKNCRFRGEVDFSGLNSETGLEIINCIFENGFSINNSSLSGDMIIRECLVLRNYSHSCSNLEMQNLSCKNIEIDGLCYNGPLDMSNLSADSCFIYGLSLQDSLYMYRSVMLKFCSINNIAIDGDCALWGNAVSQGPLGIYEHFIITGDLGIDGIKTLQNIQIVSSKGQGRVGGELSLSGAESGSSIFLENIKVGKKVDLSYSRARNIRVSSSRFLRNESGGDAENQGPFTVSDCIDISCSKIENNLYLFDVVVEPDAGNSCDRASLILQNTEINNDLRLFASKEWLGQNGYIIKVDTPCTSSFAGGIDLSKAKIGGEADLTGVQCSMGGINLDDILVSHDLKIVHMDQDGAARAGYLTMNNSVCEGNAVFTGLEIAPGCECCNGISAQHSRFLKSLIVAQIIDESKEEVCCRIFQFLDLSGSEIFELSISNRIFEVHECAAEEGLALSEEAGKEQTGPAAAASRNGIILNQATVNKLTTILYRNEYPRPLDLRFAEIKWWSFITKDGVHSGYTEDFIKMLACDPNPQRHTFRSIEKNLIDQGNEEAADAVHKQMRKWLRKQKRTRHANPVMDKFFIVPHLVRKVSLWFLDSVTGSMTTPNYLLAIVAVWLTVSVFFFSKPENIEPSSEAIQTYGAELKPHQTPGKGQWKGLSSFWLSLQCHVPVVTIAANQQWKPSGSRNLLLFKSGKEKTEKTFYAPVSAEDYANIVMGLHWILWPLIIALASRKIFRRNEK